MYHNSILDYAQWQASQPESSEIYAEQLRRMWRPSPLLPGEQFWLTPVPYGGQVGVSGQVDWNEAERFFSANAARRRLLLARTTNAFGRRLAPQDMRVSALVVSVEGLPDDPFLATPVRTVEDVQAKVPYAGLVYSAQRHRKDKPRAIAVLFLDRPHTLPEALRLRRYLQFSLNDPSELEVKHPLEPVFTCGMITGLDEDGHRWFDTQKATRLSINQFEPGAAV